MYFVICGNEVIGFTSGSNLEHQVVEHLRPLANSVEVSKSELASWFLVTSADDPGCEDLEFSVMFVDSGGICSETRVRDHVFIDSSGGLIIDTTTSFERKLFCVNAVTTLGR